MADSFAAEEFPSLELKRRPAAGIGVRTCSGLCKKEDQMIFVKKHAGTGSCDDFLGNEQECSSSPVMMMDLPSQHLPVEVS
ncbi:hypothetical protein NQZ68_001309 [Dissostichus eleginoides]|nr:hypothetical protein NQZ68_001309 [Dissostichus eleginoides]